MESILLTEPHISHHFIALVHAERIKRLYFAHNLVALVEEITAVRGVVIGT